MPPRYLKLGAAKNTDKDTSLFQPDHHPQHQHRNRSNPSWPSLRRSQSSREGLEESPRRLSVTYDREARAAVENDGDEARREMARRKIEEHEARRKKDYRQEHEEPGPDLERGRIPEVPEVPEVPELRRAKSSTIHRGEEGLSIQYRHGKDTDRGFFPKVHLPRAQSMRYNRIVSAVEESLEGGGGAIDPPRHSCVERFCVEKRMDGKSKPLVRVSGSHQTSDGEILSIECAQCGRWLGTVAQRVDLDEGSIKLCRICHPQEPDHDRSKAAAAAENRRSGGFLRGLRRMFGGLKGSSRKNSIERERDRR